MGFWHDTHHRGRGFYDERTGWQNRSWLPNSGTLLVMGILTAAGTVFFGREILSDQIEALNAPVIDVELRGSSAADGVPQSESAEAALEPGEVVTFPDRIEPPSPSDPYNRVSLSVGVIEADEILQSLPENCVGNECAEAVQKACSTVATCDTELTDLIKKDAPEKQVIEAQRKLWQANNTLYRAVLAYNAQAGSAGDAPLTS